MNKEPTARFLTGCYIAALGAVACLSLASHLTLDNTLKAHAGAASVINVSGRQRMLSQRIASLAAQYELGDDQARTELRDAIDEFEHAHRKLVHGSAGAGANDAPRLHALYFSGPQPLDAQMHAYVARARRIAAMSRTDPRMQGELAPLFAAARRPLLDGLNRVTAEHQLVSEAQLRRLKAMQLGAFLLVLATLAAEAFGVFRPMVKRIIRYTGELNYAATTDTLTGAANRRSFAQRAEEELARARRHGRPTALLAIDADRFKSVNDAHGHAVGDAVLVALSRTVAGVLRPSDLFGRMGGEEFAVLLPETTLEGAELAAERLRAAIADIRVPVGATALQFTVSLGVTEFTSGEADLKAAMERADKALYQAKLDGRNRFVSAPAPSPRLELVDAQVRTVAA